MTTLATVIVLVVASLHVWFMVLEMFLWTKPTGLKAFRQSPDKARDSAVLAANQGLYNGFLAAGLFYGAWISDPLIARQFQIFFLACVAIAGAYGGYSVNRRIFFIQGVPALVGLALLIIAA